jgi:hypothetical protein
VLPDSYVAGLKPAICSGSRAMQAGKEQLPLLFLGVPTPTRGIPPLNVHGTRAAGRADSRFARRPAAGEHLPQRCAPPGAAFGGMEGVAPLFEGRATVAVGPDSGPPAGGEGSGLLPSGGRVLRWDQPSEVKGRRRGSAGKVFEILRDPRVRHEAVQVLEEATLANTTKPVYCSRERTLRKFARHAGFDCMWPLTRPKLLVVFGAMKMAGYRAAPYLEFARRTHKRKSYLWTQDLQVLCEDLRRAVNRGQGPATKAALFEVESIVNALEVQGPIVPNGPRWPGRMAAIAAWFLLREIEVSLLTVERVSFPASGVARLDLGPTKSDPTGRGKGRAQSCTCNLGAEAAKLCPFHLLLRQVQLRKEEGASLDDVLFPTLEGTAADKNRVVASWAAVLRAIDGVITGHSPRRTGAQLFTEKGIPPWETEWFGRWGSSAVRGYVEDARARSQEGADIARKVFLAAPSLANTDSKAPVFLNATSPYNPSLCDVQAELIKFCGSITGTKEDMFAAVRAQFEAVKGDIILEAICAFEEKGHEAILVGNLISGKVHAVGSRTLCAAPRMWETLCGWRFGLLDGRSARRNVAVPNDRRMICVKCWRKGRKLGLAEKASNWALPDEILSSSDDEEESTSSDSSSSESNPL